MAGERILIVEDEPGIAPTLEDSLQAAGYRVTVSHGTRGEEEARTGGHDLLILDLGLPGCGLSFCQNLRRSDASPPILILTTRGSDRDMVGLAQEADDTLTKPFDMAELLVRLEALLRRARSEPAPPAHIRDFGLFRLDATKGELLQSGVPQAINTQEFRLLCYLAAHPNRAIERGEILQQVWGYGNGTTTRTVDVHVAKLRHHLGESGQPRHILTVRGLGYRFHP